MRKGIEYFGGFVDIQYFVGILLRIKIITAQHQLIVFLLPDASRNIRYVLHS